MLVYKQFIRKDSGMLLTSDDLNHEPYSSRINTVAFKAYCARAVDCGFSVQDVLVHNHVLEQFEHQNYLETGKKLFWVKKLVLES